MHEVKGCTKVTLELAMAVAIKQLELHHSQVHSLARKPDKPKHPELTMAGDAVEDSDFDRFLFMFEQYKQLAGIATNASGQLLECFSPEIYQILYDSSSPTSGGLWLNLSLGTTPRHGVLWVTQASQGPKEGLPSLEVNMLPHHYQHLCSRKGVPPPPRETGSKKSEEEKAE